MFVIVYPPAGYGKTTVIVEGRVEVEPLPAGPYMAIMIPATVK